MRKDSKILSQWEIDALLQSLPDDEEAAEAALAAAHHSPRHDRKNVKPYDFRRPDKFSKDQIRTLQALHQSFARMASTALSSQLRSAATVKVSSIEQSLYEEYIQQLANPTTIYVVDMDPLPGSIILEYSMDLALACIDRLLGGSGQVLDQPHEMTDIELTLLRGLARSFIGPLAEAWENLAPLQPKLQEIALSSQLAQVATTGDVCIVVLFELSVNDIIGGMSICLPFVVLETVLPKLTNQALLVSGHRRKATETDKLSLRQNLRHADVPMTALLGSADITTGELLDMQVGDVIRLDAPVTRPCEVLIAGQRKFRGYPGTVRNRMSIRISDVLKEQESEVGDLAETEVHS